MRRLTVSVTATGLALLGLLSMKAGAAAKSSTATSGTAGDGGGTVVVTGPQIVLAHGIVQVRATLVDGRLIDVAALSLPHDNPHSWDDSTAAAAILRSEVLAKQSAAVNVVSGATYTSRGYMSSLQAALDAAGHR